MLDPRGLYEIVDDIPALDGPVLVHALEGFMDAGAAGKGLTDHLLAALDHRIIVRFDTDQLHDYRARRPEMTFVKDHFERYATPELGLHVAHDDAGSAFLLLVGPEPDLQWERFVAAVVGLVEQLGVRLTVGLHGIPMAVPHTRPIGVTTHATRPDLVLAANPWDGEIRLPASASSLLELRLGEAGHDAMGFAVHVPHYLAQADYPDASLALLRSLSAATGLLLPADGLVQRAEETRRMVEAQVSDSDEVKHVVAQLETQYDAYVGSASRRGLLAAEPQSLPTAEQIGEEFERFLEGLERDEE